MENKRESMKKFIKDNLDFIVPLVIIGIVLLVAGRFAWHWLQYDVKAIDSEFMESDGEYTFIYEGKNLL